MYMYVWCLLITGAAPECVSFLPIPPRGPYQCFIFIDEQRTWADAGQSCIEEYGGHLATVTSRQMHGYLAQQMSALGWAKLWIGAKEVTYSDHLWADGSPLGSTNKL